MKHVLEELAPKFEKASGHKLNIVWGTGVGLAKKMMEGEQTDLAILTREGLDTVLKGGKVVSQHAGLADPREMRRWIDDAQRA